MKYHLVTLGCAKNISDSDGMSTLLDSAGHNSTSTPDDAELLIVNTCGFLQAARDESVDVLGQLGVQKRQGQILVAAGCLPQRIGDEIVAEVPWLDGVIGTQQWPRIVELVETIQERHLQNRWRPYVMPPDDRNYVAASVARQNKSHSAYLKISDGCSAPCAFCTIPSFKGKQRSKRPSEVLREAQQLVDHGAEEIVLVAQDLTAYGHDWGEPTGMGLPTLLEMLCTEIEHEPGRLGYRLMYAYPGHANQPLIEVMARYQGLILPYLDMPLQHGDRRVLKRMRRPHKMERQAAFFRTLREALPEVTLRSTFIVGFPGESEAEFQGLLDFLSEMQFDKVGVFPYSPEPGTPAGAMADQIPEAVKQARWERAMAHQQPIALAKQERMVGQRLDVLVDGYDAEQDVTLCRSYREAPEVDGYIVLPGRYEPGARLKVRVTAAYPYDLEAELLSQCESLASAVPPPHEMSHAAIPMPAIEIMDIPVQ